MSIPKKIHFVWLGGRMPGLYRALIRRCEELNPGWQVTLWNGKEVSRLVRRMGTGLEGRFEQADLTLSSRADLARYHIVAHEGGIYLDTDFLVLRPLESLRAWSLFGVYQQPGLVCSGAFGAVRGHPLFEGLFEHLRSADYRLPPEQLAGPWMFSPYCLQAAVRDPASALYPRRCFLPIRFDEKNDSSAWLKRDLSQSYAVHLWSHSWGPGGGDEPKELLARIGAILLNPSSSCPSK
jgi:mannosyltransferase OCH1-like enzyme